MRKRLLLTQPIELLRISTGAERILESIGIEVQRSEMPVVDDVLQVVRCSDGHHLVLEIRERDTTPMFVRVGDLNQKLFDAARVWSELYQYSIDPRFTRTEEAKKHLDHWREEIEALVRRNLRPDLRLVG